MLKTIFQIAMLLLAIGVIDEIRRWVRRRKRYQMMIKGAWTMTPGQLISSASKSSDVYKYLESAGNQAGVYILTNTRNGRRYVGQAKNILPRASQHFKGRGCPELYTDYRRGVQFTVQLIALNGSGYKTLNSLEHNLISYYNAYHRGYNKTRGNAG